MTPEAAVQIIREALLAAFGLAAPLLLISIDGMRPEYVTRADEHALKIVKVDIDSEQGLAQRYGVQSIPMMILFKEGEPAAAAVGAHPKSSLERALGLSES